MKNIKLVEARNKMGLTQVQIANKAGITEVSYQRIEYGTQRPSLDTAILIADTLGVRTYKAFKELFGAAAPGTDGNQPEDNNTSTE